MSESLVHTIVTYGLIYIAAGSFVWICLDQCGVIENQFEAKRRRLGRPVTLFFAIKSTLAMILVWPKFAWITWKRRKEAWAKLKRVVWR